MDTVKILSLNAKGLNTPEKGRMLTNDRKRSQADVAFIQETHFRDNKLPILKNRFYPVTYHSTNNLAKSKDVSILLSSRLPWSCQNILVDQAGRYIFIKELIGEVKVTFASIYAPNECQDFFLSRPIDLLMEISEGQLILGGDFNVPLLPNVDASSGSSSITPGVRKRVARTLHKAQLIDVWRLQHSGEKDYTFYSFPHKFYSFIDFFLIPHAQLQVVHDTAIGTTTWSDHAPTELTYKLSDLAASRTRF